LRKSLVTINLNNVLAQNARQSFCDAAERWGASYVELTVGLGPGLSPMALKLKLFELTDADRVFYVDGSDVIIAKAAPSPFSECPPEVLGAVRNAYPRFPNYLAVRAQEDTEWEIINDQLGQSLPMSPFFFNAGVMLLTRRPHTEVLERAASLAGSIKGLKWYDQTVLNYAVAEAGVPVLQMDETWNFVHAQTLGHWRWMDKYIYHFAGSDMRSTVLPTLDWRAPIPRRVAFARTMCQVVARTPVLGALVRELSSSLRGMVSALRTSPLGALKAGLRKVPVLGLALRYVYWWLTLPCRVNRLLDELRCFRGEVQGQTPQHGSSPGKTTPPGAQVPEAGRSDTRKNP